jgi:hypothetical protein
MRSGRASIAPRASATVPATRNRCSAPASVKGVHNRETVAQPSRNTRERPQGCIRLCPKRAGESALLFISKAAEIITMAPTGATTTMARREKIETMGRRMQSMAKPSRNSSNAACSAGSTVRWLDRLVTRAPIPNILHYIIILACGIWLLN